MKATRAIKKLKMALSVAHRDNVLLTAERKVAVAELSENHFLLGQSTDRLKEMCELCDKQRAEIAVEKAKVFHLESVMAAVKLLMRVQP